MTYTPQEIALLTPGTPENIQDRIRKLNLSADQTGNILWMNLNHEELSDLEEVLEIARTYPDTTDYPLFYISPASTAITSLALGITTAKTDLSPTPAIIFACLTVAFLAVACYLDFDNRKQRHDWKNGEPERIVQVLEEWIREKNALDEKEEKEEKEEKKTVILHPHQEIVLDDFSRGSLNPRLLSAVTEEEESAPVTFHTPAGS